MEGQNYLGIYLGKDTATVVCLGTKGQDTEIQGCFSVSAEGQDVPTQQELANLIAKRCSERGLKFSEVAVALDCAMFMQHNVHSEFSDTKQINATIRFDTEEALAMDITDVAIAFKIASSDQSGSALSVFTAHRKILSEIILSLQSNNIDPSTIEPDINCLSRYISQRRSVTEAQQMGILSGILSRNRGYFISPVLSESRGQSVLRTFLLSPIQDRTELLAREIPITAALVKTDESINRLKVFDSTGSVNCEQLKQRLGMETESLDLAAFAAIGSEALADCANPVDFAIAYGAALAHMEKPQSINFRNDFLPYMGKKLRLQKTLRFLSITVTILVLVLGAYFQLQLLQKNRYRSRLRKNYQKDYSAVMLGKNLPANPMKKLTGELERIKNVKSGQLSVTGEESITAKLTLILDAFNKCAAKTNLNIDTISITTKSISITGDTSSRQNTLDFRKALENTNLGNLQENLTSKGGRDNFNISIVPKK